MRHIASAALILVGILHLLPLVGVLGSDRLEAMYGVAVDEPSLQVLMRHRAVLFGILGAFLVVAGFRPAMRLGAFVAGFASVTSFLWLAWSTGGTNAEVGRVAAADVVALVALVLGFGAHMVTRRRSRGRSVA